MKMRITVRTFTGGVSIVAQSEWTECTDAEYEEVVAFVKQAAECGHYVSVGNTTIPGEFFRNHCVADVVMED
jgi:hypothetical protein